MSLPGGLSSEDPGGTLVSFHAHPDDEALLTGGTLARAAAEGHRVVIVVATSGEAGLSSGLAGARLATRRLHELEAAAGVLGVARVVPLGYPDSGYSPQGTSDGSSAGETGFASLDPAEPAARLAAILVEEQARVLTGYDAAGGYGHPDHVQVHHVARLAAQLAGTPRLLEATLPREPLARVAAVLRRMGTLLPVPVMPDLSAAYTERSRLTHRVDVRPQLDAKLAALRCHASQASGDEGRRTIALLLSLPRWLQSAVLGREWFHEPDLAGR